MTMGSSETRRGSRGLPYRGRGKGLESSSTRRRDETEIRARQSESRSRVRETEETESRRRESKAERKQQKEVYGRTTRERTRKMRGVARRAGPQKPNMYSELQRR